MAEEKYGIPQNLDTARILVSNIEKKFKKLVEKNEQDNSVIYFNSSGFAGSISQIKGEDIQYNLRSENGEYCPVTKEAFIKSAAKYDKLILDGINEDITNGCLKLIIETEKNKQAEILDRNIEQVESAPEIEKENIPEKEKEILDKEKDIETIENIKIEQVIQMQTEKTEAEKSQQAPLINPNQQTR